MKIEKLPPIFRDEASLILKNKINELIDAHNKSMLIDDQQILPCPFCGNIPGWEKASGRMKNCFYLSCEHDDCDTQPSSKILQDKEEVIKSWNTRTTK